MLLTWLLLGALAAGAVAAIITVALLSMDSLREVIGERKKMHVDSGNMTSYEPLTGVIESMSENSTTLVVRGRGVDETLELKHSERSSAIQQGLTSTVW